VNTLGVSIIHMNEMSLAFCAVRRGSGACYGVTLLEEQQHGCGDSGMEAGRTASSAIDAIILLIERPIALSASPRVP
jgi:hypothetical protein